MKEAGSYEARGFIKLHCKKCEINVWRPTYWKKYLCPVCRGELVVHVSGKEAIDAQEKKPTEIS